MIEYAKVITDFLYDPKRIYNRLEKISFKYVVLHFILISILLYIPIFGAIAFEKPNAMYGRLYGLDFGELKNIKTENIKMDTDNNNIINNIEFKDYESNYKNYNLIYTNNDNYSLSKIDNSKVNIIIYNNGILYSDKNVKLYTDIKNIKYNNLSSYNWNEIFNDIAYSNNYMGTILKSLIIETFVLECVIILFFYMATSFILNFTRFTIRKLGFMNMMKIVVLTSTIPAILCDIIGIVLPAIHIFIFQLVMILWAVKYLKKYDKLENELI